jgi:hypothetical protein
MYSNLLIPVNPVAQPIRPLAYREKHMRGANGLCTHDGLTIPEGGGRDIFGRCNGNNFVLVRDYCKHLNILTLGCYHLLRNLLGRPAIVQQHQHVRSSTVHPRPYGRARAMGTSLYELCGSSAP